MKMMERMHEDAFMKVVAAPHETFLDVVFILDG
jgi:hypothetical protein